MFNENMRLETVQGSDEERRENYIILGGSVLFRKRQPHREEMALEQHRVRSDRDEFSVHTSQHVVTVQAWCLRSWHNPCQWLRGPGPCQTLQVWRKLQTDAIKFPSGGWRADCRERLSAEGTSTSL